MTREVIGKSVRLRSSVGIIDKRSGRIHHEVICSLKAEKYFVEIQNEEVGE